jgi:hypothetical protein
VSKTIVREGTGFGRLYRTGTIKVNIKENVILELSCDDETFYSSMRMTLKLSMTYLLEHVRQGLHPR